MPIRFLPTLASGAIATLLLAACDSATQAPGELDIVARVNGEEITVRQLNERMTQAGLPVEGGPAAGRRKALDDLVNERLLVQQALTAGLDQEPRMRQAMEQSRRQLLARSVVETDDIVADADVRAFFEANPNLFAGRKVYTFHRFTLAEGRLDRPTRARLDAAKTPRAVAAALKQAGLAHAVVTETVTAEALPPGILSRAARMASGDVLLFRDRGRTVLMQLSGSVAEPLALADAAPAIEDYLAEATLQRNADRILRDLRRKSKIEYVTQSAAIDGKSPVRAAAKSPAAEPPLQKPIQTRQITAVR